MGADDIAAAATDRSSAPPHICAPFDAAKRGQRVHNFANCRIIRHKFAPILVVVWPYEKTFLAEPIQL